MPGTAKVTMKGEILSAESSDLLKMAKHEKLVKIQPYQIRTEINLQSAGFNEMQKKAAELSARREANRVEEEFLKKIDTLVAELKKFIEMDERGNDKAGDLAEKRVKSVSDDLEDSLPEFGKRIRKAVEKTLGKTLPGTAKSASSGGFRGIKLIYRFEHGGVSEEIVKGYQDAAKSLDQAAEQAMTKSKEDKKATDALKQSVRDQFNAVAKVTAKNDPEVMKKLVEDIPNSARTLGKEVEGYADKVEAFQEALEKTQKMLDREMKDLAKDLSTSEFRNKKDKFDRVDKELQALQKAVNIRLQDIKPVSQKLKDAEKYLTAKQWQIGLMDITAKVAKFDPISADTFNKAADTMVMEGKKKA
jgi:hypothetical protein